MKSEKEILERIRETSYQNVMTALNHIDAIMTPKEVPEPEPPPVPEGMACIVLSPRTLSWDEIRNKLWAKHEELRLLTWVLEE
jgi:hypothetical protein